METKITYQCAACNKMSPKDVMGLCATCDKKGFWVDPAGGVHPPDEDGDYDPASAYE